MFLGYLRYSGVELANEQRTSAYANNLGLRFFAHKPRCGTLMEQIFNRGWESHNKVYTDPATDGAPWYDPNYHDVSNSFAGISLLDATNTGESTSQALIQELPIDGASIQSGRRRSREMVFTAILFGRDLRSLHYGLTWLTTLLREPDYCDSSHFLSDEWSPIGCRGNSLEFAHYCPTGGSAWREILDTHLLAGPRILDQRGSAVNCADGAWMRVEFTLVAGNPSVWHPPAPLSRIGVNINYRLLTDHWLYYKGGEPLPVDDDIYDAPNKVGLPHTYAGLRRTVVLKSSNTSPVISPPRQLSSGRVTVVDPTCPETPGMPPIPQEGLLCSEPYDGVYNRTSFLLRSDILPRHYPLAMLAKVTAMDQEFRDIRLLIDYATDSTYRLHISYLPPNSTLYVDTRMRTISISKEGSDWSPAGQLVFKNEQGFAFDFQEILCPEEMQMHVDVPEIYPEEKMLTEFAFAARDV